MVRARQETAPAGTLVARFSLRSFMPHALFGWASVALASAVLAADGASRTLALVMLALASLALAAGAGVLATKLDLAVDREGVSCALDGLVVPWADVVGLSLDAVGQGGALRLQVRDGRELLARQSPEVSVWPGRRRQLAESGVLVLPLAWLDRSPSEIFEAAAARVPAGQLATVPAQSDAERRIERKRRLFLGLALATFLLQLVVVVGLVL